MERKRRVSGEDERTGDDACNGRRRNSMRFCVRCIGSGKEAERLRNRLWHDGSGEEAERLRNRLWHDRSREKTERLRNRLWHDRSREKTKCLRNRLWNISP